MPADNFKMFSNLYLHLITNQNISCSYKTNYKVCMLDLTLCGHETSQHEDGCFQQEIDNLEKVQLEAGIIVS